MIILSMLSAFALESATPSHVPPVIDMHMHAWTLDEFGGESVRVVLEEGLADAAPVNVHPLRNTATVGLAGADILRLLRHWRHDPQVAEVPVAG